MIKSLVFFVLVFCGYLGAEETVKAFSDKGILVDAQNFFKNAKIQPDASTKKRFKSGHIAFVNEKGVFSFLEREETEKLLKEYNVGDQVDIKGKVLESGKLLEIETIEKVKEAKEYKLSEYQEKDGEPILLEGVNKCQCGLKVSELSHSCKLGHLHHLQTNDGKIYHYLEAGKSQDMKMHFKKMKVNALLFPGNFIKIVDAIE